MEQTRSNMVRTPAQVAQMMRYTAHRTAQLPGLAPSLFGTLLTTWADILDRAPRAPLHEVTADHLALSAEIEFTADTIAAECGCNGRFELSREDVPGFIAWLREIARQAAELQVRAAGFHFDRGESALAGTRDPRVLDMAPAPHPDDVVPGLQTGAGAPVTYSLMERLRVQRQQRTPTRPCDTEERP